MPVTSPRRALEPSNHSCANPNDEKFELEALDSMRVASELGVKARRRNRKIGRRKAGEVSPVRGRVRLHAMILSENYQSL